MTNYKLPEQCAILGTCITQECIHWISVTRELENREIIIQENIIRKLLCNFLYNFVITLEYNFSQNAFTHFSLQCNNFPIKYIPVFRFHDLHVPVMIL